MPHPPLYAAGQDDDRTRSIDVVHIEPSIREGVHLVSSLYGPLASAPLYRFPPVSSDNAWIRGDAVIPSVLTAEEGTWTASPSAYFEYQWMANGIDIPFATQKQWTSTIDYDGQEITVEIRGINYLGQDITISSGLGISILEPIITQEQENFVITGMPQGLAAQTTRDERTIVISGLGTDDRLDVNRAVSYYLTGFGALDRDDVNAMNVGVVTGLGATDRLDVLERDLSVAVINQQYADPLVESVPVVMALKNPDAELGTFGWNIFGTVWAVDDIHIVPGYFAWNGGDNVGPTGSNTQFSYIWQDVPIEAPWIVDVDAGLTNVELEWQQYSFENQDMGNVRVEFFDVNMTLIGQDNGPGLYASPNGIFFRRGFEAPVPVGTRFVRVYAEFNLQSGNNNDAHIDSIKLSIRKGAKINARDFGPLFEQWRLNFLQARTWSGCGLSELEFRATSGGADLATGGQPIFGSAGLGVLNADFAFDDLRNTGYWAGEENGVANGRAWFGYDMQTPVRPEAIDITARTGSDSLQVGRQAMIQASNDGIRWTDVMYIPESRIGEFSSGQQKEILLPRGPYDFYRNYTGGDTYSYSHDQFSGDDYAGKGALFQSYSRMNIDEISVLIDDNQASPFNFRLQLYRCNLQKGGTFYPGMVSEILEDIPLQSAGLNAGLTWVTQACSQSWEFEVNELFLLRFFDVDAATNPVDPNEGRTRWIGNQNGAPSPFELRNGIADRVCIWAGGSESLVVGSFNGSGFQGGGIGAYFALDFKGTIY